MPQYILLLDDVEAVCLHVRNRGKFYSTIFDSVLHSARSVGIGKVLESKPYLIAPAIEILGQRVAHSACLLGDHEVEG